MSRIFSYFFKQQNIARMLDTVSANSIKSFTWKYPMYHSKSVYHGDSNAQGYTMDQVVHTNLILNTKDETNHVTIEESNEIKIY